MKRIIIHWTAGAYAASKTDKMHYHFIVEGTGRVVSGDLTPEDNLSTKTAYAAHTRGMNTGSIGVALAAMHGAVERPFSAGKYPIIDKQVDALVKLVAGLCDEYDIPVTRETVLTHAEVQHTLGVAQRGKWDIMWLPHMPAPDLPIRVGDHLRGLVKDALQPASKPVTGAPKSDIVALIIAFLKRLFR